MFVTLLLLLAKIKDLMQATKHIYYHLIKFHIMDRVKTLLEKLNEQINNSSPVADILLTIQMMKTELVHFQGVPSTSATSPVIAVNFPLVYDAETTPSESSIVKEQEQKIEEAEKDVQVLQVNEEDMAAELEEIKRNVAERENMMSQNKPQLQFDPVEDIPTLYHQQPNEVEPLKELHQVFSHAELNTSLNDKLKIEKIELSDSLSDSPVKDLKKAISLNDRFVYIRELFRDDEAMYERSIKTINGFSIFAEAEFWIKRELKLKLGWNEKEQIVKDFDHLVRRRFA